ncbi:DNA cytosine methyltransferase [Paraglaciecola hydrolytica]|uniref:Cytosine-specific methyltransferase n=1 Tax=Paraglaciecola hydrolytica TaxID=1799789 RepID=A0A148KKH4_9ALTE|nr:DNA cytosine methyltransferase [Paraglaciecola hydrolytica]KXI26775.1 DNA methyltransferase [Paraglaciecola hydrolytica]
MNHIELFAGCGGLSLGLEKSGFKLSMANELSPMAAESFAYNFFDENLEELANVSKKAKNTLWLNSAYADLKARLRENPFEFPTFGEVGNSDLPKDFSNLKGKLIVGSIVELNRLLDKNSDLVHQLRTAFGAKRGLDLVSGGPPCQSFSMAGLRKQDCEKNTLPWEFAKFVEHTQPKIAMLENVTGILRAFQDKDGNSFHAWYEVAKVFATIGYVPLCLHINARLAGIAQNRPRFIMIAVKFDHVESILQKFDDDSANTKLFTHSLDFYNLVKKVGSDLPFGHLSYFDATKPSDLNLFENSFLASLVNGEAITVRDALDDLKQTNPSKPSKFVNLLNATFEFLPQRKSLSNHEFRSNGEVVKRRFRLYQVLRSIDERRVTTAIFSVLKGDEITLPDDIWSLCKPYEFLQKDGQLSKFVSKEKFIDYLKSHPTKKQTQKALVASSPAPAALSIPDDACHYDEHELRVLTVREMARIQSFPDNFVFRSKITTGGQMRKFEVPQYTQVGNAVPPLLGLRLGQCVKKLL